MKYSKVAYCVLVLILHFCHAAWDDPFYDYRGQNSFRESQPNAPYEQFDPFTGNFRLVYTDLFLPGNGGLDLRIMRVYNSNIRRYKYDLWHLVDDSWIGLGWSMHMGRLVYPENFDYRYLEMPDGSKHKFYSDISSPGQWISKEYWILRQDGDHWEVLFPSGQRWWFNGYICGHYSEEGGPIPYYPTKTISEPIMYSPTGHQISIYYEVINDQTMIYKIIDSCDREIYFYYETSGMMNLQSIYANGKWIHYHYDDIGSGYSLLRRVRYPECPSDRGDYYYTYTENPPGLEYELQLVQDNYGSETEYSFTTRTILARQYRILCQRQEYHDNLGDMNWYMTYGTTTYNWDSTAIIDPYNTTTSYVYYGYHNPPTPGNNWKLGLMMRKRIVGAGVNLVISATHDHSPAISNDDYSGPTTDDPQVYVPRVVTREYTIDNKTYGTNYSNFDAYNHPRTLTETGDISRTITRTYWLCPTEYYIVDRLASENIQSGTSNHLTTYSYRDDGKMTTKNVSGVTTTYMYHGEPTSPEQSGNLGNLKSIIDAAYRWVEYDDYEYGVPKVINKGVYPINRTVNWEGTIASETNGRGYTTFYGYDGQNRLVQITPPEGDPTITQFNLYYGRDKTVSRGLSWTTYYYDEWARVDSTVNSVGVKISYEYDAFDRKTYESYPYATVNIGRSFEYDGLDRIKKITNPDGSYGQYTYYQSKVNYRNELGKYTEFQYHAFGNLFADKWLALVKDALNQTTDYEYNVVGYLTSLTADGGYTRSYHYNSKYFMDYEISPERGQTNYSYDNAGNLIQRTDANGDATNYTYDNATRLTNIDYPGTSYDVSYCYDKADNCTLMTTPAATCSLFYDPLNQLTKKKLLIDGYAYTGNFTYDSRGNITRVTYPGDWFVDFTYDSENRVLTIPGYINANIAYHPSGKEASFTATNGRTTTCTYNNRYWTSNITVDGNAMNESYQYDQSGNLTTLTDNLSGANNQSFTYDDVCRLKTFNGPWGNGTYNYATGYAISRRYQEIIGANTTTYYYHSTTHRLYGTRGADPYRFTYDNNGNLTGITDKLILTYDYENRPVSINNLELQTTDIVYNAKGERVKKVLGPPTLSEVTYYYLTGLQGEVLCEIQRLGQSKTYYVYLNGRKLCKVNGTNTYFYHNDYLGSAKAMTNNSGTKVYSWLGYPFGRQYDITGAGYNNYRFTGKEYDASTGLYYFGARYYMPEIGRFITPDHIAGVGTLDLTKPIALNYYNYATDNPLKYVDPNGNREMTVREVEIVNRIMASAEQAYFSELGKANDQIRSTGGSWPEDIAAERMNPVSLEGLPGELSLSYLLKWRAEQILSIIDPNRSDISGLTGTLPTLKEVLVYENASERVMAYPGQSGSEKHIRMILSSPSNLKGQGGREIRYFGQLTSSGARPVIIVRYLSPEAYKDWLKRIEDLERLEIE
jgi:RHS repeat-associated protein